MRIRASAAGPSPTPVTSKPSRRSRVASARRADDSSSTMRIRSNINSAETVNAPVKQMYPVRYFGTTRKGCKKCNWQIRAASERTARGHMKRTLPPESLNQISARLQEAHKALQRRYPGSLADRSAERQPVHVVYGGAHLFRSGTKRRLGNLALQSMDEYAPDFAAFAKDSFLSPERKRLPNSHDAVSVIEKAIEADPEGVQRENHPAWLAHTLYRRVREKLKREPVEDFRIDLEDGYGNRPDNEERPTPQGRRMK